MPDVILEHTDYAFALDLLEATGFDLHFPSDAAADMTDPEFRRVVEHRDRSAAQLAAIIARVRRSRPAAATAHHHVFAERLCVALGVKSTPERVKAIARLQAEQHEVAVACAVVRMESNERGRVRPERSESEALVSKKPGPKKRSTRVEGL